MQIRLVMVSALIALGLACCVGQAAQDNSRDIAEIKALSASRAKAFNEGNSNVIAEAFSETGVLMAPGAGSTTGRDAVRKYYQNIFDEYRCDLKSGYEEVKVSGDLAYGVGWAQVKLVPHDGGDTLVSSAKYINVLQRQKDGTWLTTHDIWNSNEP